MTTVEFMSRLRELGVRLSYDGERLKYQAPPGLLTASDFEELKSRKTEVITLIDWQRFTQSQITKAPRSEILRPSLEEEGWWHSIATGHITGADWLHLSTALYLHGDLDTVALEQAATAILTRHEVLRSRFTQTQGRLQMHIDEPSAVQIETTDLSHISGPEARAAETRTLATEFVRIPFGSLAERLVRMKLFRLSATEHVLVVTVHHILADVRSLSKVVTELKTFYRSYVTGTASGIEVKPALQYADYATWQRAWLTYERQEYFLQMVRTRLSQPLIFPEDPTATPAGNKVYCRYALSSELIDTIGAFAKEHATTKYLVILTALVMVLSKWTGQSKVPLASVGNLRINEQLMDMVGPFSVFDLLCADLTNVTSFREAVTRVHKAFAESQDYRPYAPTTQYKSLVNVFVDYVGGNSPDAQTKGDGDAAATSGALKFRTFPWWPKKDDALSQWALIVLAQEVQGRVEGTFVFSLARFGKDTVEKAISRFKALLEENFPGRQPM